MNKSEKIEEVVTGYLQGKSSAEETRPEDVFQTQRIIMLCRPFSITLSSCCHNNLTTRIYSFMKGICRALYGMKNGLLDAICLM